MAESRISGSDGRQVEFTCEAGGQTETLQLQECPEDNAPTLHLRLSQPKSGHKVKWTSETVDNEFMGKKKSKCCCVYEKPKVFGESSSSEDNAEDDGCTPNCKGHKKKCYRKKPHHHGNDDHHHDHHHHDNENGAVAGPSNGLPDV